MRVNWCVLAMSLYGLGWQAVIPDLSTKERLYIGSTPVPNQKARLWVDGEVIARTVCDGPEKTDGHPCTPAGFRREAMPVYASVATGLNLAMTTCTGGPAVPCPAPDPWFGVGIGFQATHPLDGRERGLGGMAPIWKPDGGAVWIIWGRRASGDYSIFAALDETGLQVDNLPSWLPLASDPPASPPRLR